MLKLKPKSLLELGTCVGISAAYQGSACQINQSGALMTIEGSPALANIAKQTLQSLEIFNTEVVIGPFHSTLETVLKSLAPVDFFFNDGHHDGDAVIEYWRLTLPYFADEAVVIFDDISWSPGM